MGHRISDSKKQREDFERSQLQGRPIDKLIDNLTISSFSALDPQNLPASDDLAYGNTEIEALSLQYSTPKETGGVELEPIYKWSATNERLFKQVNFKESSLQAMAKKLSSEIEEQFQQAMKLLTFAITVPISSVDCEHGFSKQNQRFKQA